MVTRMEPAMTLKNGPSKIAGGKGKMHDTSIKMRILVRNMCNEACRIKQEAMREGSTFICFQKCLHETKHEIDFYK